ncbi:BadM/Rrf2 family transcriptional regulator [Bradyrhizobium macuxiense]|uniref:BadM/Rrf2 family transcriptional regulator n=2 Tax=Bradyrhizobium macuxiense TaxID=1755647 RepID=A0A560M4L3_9BRAD|nr:BadM/Rrf2 family transcriptional regulator [Bradyrhizobium macuxiense]
MAHVTVSVEYGIHCLLWLVGSGDTPLSSRDLAELQGISPSFVAKIFPKLERAGIVEASEGAGGGYVLARSPAQISFLDIVDAIEGDKPLFDCQDVRWRCPLFGATPPTWATKGTCAVHAVMLRAEKAMRDALAEQTLGDVAQRFGHAAPAAFFAEVQDWISDRVKDRPRRSDRSDRPGKPSKRRRRKLKRAGGT